MRRFRFREGFPALKGVSPDVVAAEFQDIHDTFGVVDIDEAVRRARDPVSPLHPICEWDDETAAGEYRRSQMRDVVISLRLVTEDAPGEIATVQYLHYVNTDEVKGYRTLDVVLSEPDEYEYVVKQARSQIQSARNKLASLSKAERVVKTLDRALSGLEKI